MPDVYTNDYQRKRGKQLKLWYTQAEYNVIKTAAAEAGKPMNEYVLEAVNQLASSQKEEPQA